MFKLFKKKREILEVEEERQWRETLELIKDAHGLVGVLGIFLTSYTKYMKTSQEMLLLHSLSHNLHHMESRIQGHLFKLRVNTHPREEWINVIRNPDYLEVDLVEAIKAFLEQRDIESLKIKPDKSNRKTRVEK
ncbi:MAG: hypothetical protein OQK04_10620 [Kangiellaceae bacterium]|nr:hypothetical protein [Kangiellaceae bacterium]MCW8999158.1 hypothetical protein [Kangiellaceae bacterium]